MGHLIALGPLAQRIEHPTHNRRVIGSSPIGATMRVLSTKEEKLLELFLELAGGDVELLYRAFLEAAQGAPPTIDEIVNFLSEHKKEIN